MIDMCMAIRYKHHMGRNYDYEQSYDETIINIPRETYGNQYAIIGICAGINPEYPLLYDGMNEHGLCCAALAFTGNAKYNPMVDGKFNIPAYDFILETLGDFHNVKSVAKYLKEVNITDKAYDDRFPNTDLHWFICDRNMSLTVEATCNYKETQKGTYVYENRYDVLTNNPPFLLQAESYVKQNSLVGTYPFKDDKYRSRGTETYGLLGDTTSMSRFQRARHYMKNMLDANSPFNDTVETFHILGTAEQVYGATPVNSDYEYTIYKAAYDMDSLSLYVKRYDCLDVCEYDLDHEREWRCTI